MISLKMTDILASEGYLQMEIPIGNLSFGSFQFYSDVILINLNIHQVGNEIRIKSHSEAKIKKICDRCLTQFFKKIHGSFEILLTENSSLLLDEKDEDIYFFPADQTEIDLEPIVRESFFLDDTLKHLCNEDCKGLCVNCGVNLNKNKCDCTTDNIDERWTPLQKISFN